MHAFDELRSELAEFDGKATSMLSEIAARHRGQKPFLENVIKLSGDEDSFVADGATWIVKAHLDEGRALGAAQISLIVHNALKTHSWAAQLHLCQIIGRLQLTRKDTAALAPWTASLLRHKRPFLRAWSLDALCSLALIDEALVKKAKRALKDTSKDPAASVRARARNIRLP